MSRMHDISSVLERLKRKCPRSERNDNPKPAANGSILQRSRPYYGQPPVNLRPVRFSQTRWPAGRFSLYMHWRQLARTISQSDQGPNLW